MVGFGERYDAVDQRGLTLDSVVFEQYKGQGRARRTYFPMPFAHILGGGWGFHVRTSRRVWFDVGASDPSKLVVESEVGPDGRVAVDVFSGSPVEVLGSFLDQAGRAEPLPAWVHRLWASGNEWNTQASVMAQMDAHRDHGVPVGAVVIEAWSDEEGITVFRDAEYAARPDGSPFVGADLTYPADGAWPDPRGMVDGLHARDVKVLLSQIPLLKSGATFALEDQPHGSQVISDGEALVRSGFVVKGADGQPYLNRGWWFPKALMPDLSTPAGREWWASRRRYLVRDLGVDGFKTDGGEHAWGGALRYDDGTRGDDGNNLNPARYARAYGDLLRSCGKVPVTFSRSGYTGSWGTRSWRLPSWRRGRRARLSTCRVAAMARIGRRDPADWPVLAAALALGCPIWTEDADFFGVGVATWVTALVEIYLAPNGEWKTRSYRAARSQRGERHWRCSAPGLPSPWPGRQPRFGVVW
ncbi:MAG: hypothetical protein LBK95_11655 [Bifidobacteriaceae bacterium]|nr:hypothetical protein [Bifidobacteriaceae bacterium]